MLIFPVSNVYSFNNNLAIVDFPVPLAPTIAILAPLFICNEKCSNTGLSGSYPKDIFSSCFLQVLIP